MTQQPLFCEDIYEALRTIGQAYGGSNGSGSKKIGHTLWPKLPIDKAGEKWANCLNRTRAEKLDPEEVLMVLKIGRQIGCHAGIFFIDNECGYRSEVLEPENERAALMREYIQAVKTLKAIDTKLERFDERLEK